MADFIATGTVIELTARQYGDKTTHGIVIDEGKPGDKYPSELAVEFYGRAAAAIDGVRLGDTVRVEARCSSRKGKTGQWFTSAAGIKCDIQARAQAEPAGDPLPGPCEQAPCDAATDEAMPF